MTARHSAHLPDLPPRSLGPTGPTGDDAPGRADLPATAPAFDRLASTAGDSVRRVGIACAVLLVVGAALMLRAIPDAEDSEEVIARYLGNDGAQVLAVVGYVAWTAAIGCFLGFATGLHRVLRRAEPDRSSLSDVGHAAAVVLAGMLLIGGAAITAVAGAIQMGGSPAPSADFVRILPQLGFGVLRVAGGVMNAVLMVTTSLVISRTGVLPRWVARTGYVCAVVALMVITPVPLLSIPVWIVCVSVALGRRAAAGRG